MRGILISLVRYEEILHIRAACQDVSKLEDRIREQRNDAFSDPFSAIIALKPLWGGKTVHAIAAQSQSRQRR